MRPARPGQAWRGCGDSPAHVVAPSDWPTERTRLRLDVGGESLVTLAYDDGRRESFGLDPYHDEFPLLGRAFAVEIESVARAPFGQPVRAPALARAELALVELEVEALHLLSQIVEAAATLGSDEAVPHLLEAGEAALRALIWPSCTPDYVARMAPTARMQSIWRLPPVKADPPGLTEAERESVVNAREALSERLRVLQASYPPRAGSR